MTEPLVAIGEIKERLGISRQRVYQLTLRADFPAPYATLSIGRVWRRQDVEAWIARRRPHLLASGPEHESGGEAGDGERSNWKP